VKHYILSSVDLLSLFEIRRIVASAVEGICFKACAVKNLVDRDYKNINMYILLDSQAAIIPLANTRSPQNLYGIATSPSYKWPDITEFN
jgi:hypothetical protein